MVHILPTSGFVYKLKSYGIVIAGSLSIDRWRLIFCHRANLWLLSWGFVRPIGPPLDIFVLAYCFCCIDWFPWTGLNTQCRKGLSIHRSRLVEVLSSIVGFETRIFDLTNRARGPFTAQILVAIYVNSNQVDISLDFVLKSYEIWYHDYITRMVLYRKQIQIDLFLEIRVVVGLRGWKTHSQQKLLSWAWSSRVFIESWKYC